MKSQLERILNSDLSEYKIAVSEHINNLDHFEECLTERSNFMKKFNKLMQQELQRINKDPPTDFDTIQIFQGSKQVLKQLVLSSNREDIFDQQASPKRSAQYGTRRKDLGEQKQKQNNKYYCKSNSSSAKKGEVKINPKENIEYSFKDIKLSQDNIYIKKIRDRLLRLQIIGLETRRATKSLKEYIVGQVKKLSHEINYQFQNTVNYLQVHYQEKIHSLENTVSQLLRQNLQLKSEKEFQNNLNQYHKKSYYEKKDSRIQQDIQRNDDQFVIKLTTDRQYSDLQYSPPTVTLPQKKRKQQQKQQWELPNYTIHSNYIMKTNQFQMNPQMTIKNKKQNWKYYTCDLQFPELKQVHNFSKSRLNSKILDQKISHQLGLRENKKQELTSEPNLPSLLKKKVYQYFDLPTIRTLVVSYPPIQEGFSFLTLGNEVVYKGMWKYRKFHGKGKLTLPQYTYEGDFRHGLFHGFGALKLGNMQYIGLFQENKANGQGTLKIGQKSITGIWSNNSLVQQF